MRIIKLTEAQKYHENNQRYFNVDKIENFCKYINGKTYICMSESSAVFEVVETPEEIIQLIKQAKEI